MQENGCCRFPAISSAGRRVSRRIVYYELGRFIVKRLLAPSLLAAEDVRRIRSHPLVPKRIPIYGYIYDVKTGTLVEVPEATKVGAAA